MNKSELVIALYRPKPGKLAALEALVKRHFATLKECGLTSERPPFIARSSDGTIIEAFEWASAEAALSAHDNPKVGEIWGPMSEVDARGCGHRSGSGQCSRRRIGANADGDRTSEDIYEVSIRIFGAYYWLLSPCYTRNTRAGLSSEGEPCHRSR